MKIAEIKLRCWDYPNKKRFCKIYTVFWFLMGSFWLWRVTTLSENLRILYFILGFGWITLGLVYSIVPWTKVEIYDDGIKFNGKFYRWFELKVSRENSYVIFKAKKGVEIPIPFDRLSAEAKLLLQKYLNNP